MKEFSARGTIYESGCFKGNNQIWSIGLVIIDTENASASLQIERAIRYFKPDLILFLGVASGLKNVHQGDIVVATKVYIHGFHDDTDPSSRGQR